MALIGTYVTIYRRWPLLPPGRKPTLGKLLAASTNPPLPDHHTAPRRWNIANHLFPVNSTIGDTKTDGRRTTQLHLYLALGALGLNTVGLLGVPVLTLMTLPVQVYFVACFIQNGIVQVARQQQVGMDVIDGLVTSALLGLGYFWAISLYSSFFYWSRELVLRTRDRYQDRLLLIASASPQHVRIIRDATETWIELDTLELDDTVVVYAGELVPVDGVITDGLARIDQQILTGEAQPVEREAGQIVLALTLVVSGRIEVRAEQTGTSTVTAQIGSLLNDIRSYTIALTTRAEAIGNRYAAPMLALGGGTLLLLGPLSALTVLCSYVGYSLRITGPLSVLNYEQLAARSQILLKDGRALELLHRVDIVVFDKTGTLTQDQPQVVNIYSCADHSEDEVLALAVAAEHHQTHPIARALLQAANERRLFIPIPSDVRYEPGIGLQIKIDDAVVLVGSARLLEREGISLPLYTETIQAYSHQRGHSLVYVALGNTMIGIIELAAPLRPSTREVVSQLQQRDKAVWIVSGDHEQPTRWLAQTVQADAYYAGMLPSEKAGLIARLQEEGKTVCFVGDGINDALALKQANVSVSLHNAAGLAVDTAQIVLPQTNLLYLLKLFDMSSSLHTRMQGNLICSIVPGIMTIAGVYLFHFGIVAAYVLYYTGLAAGITNAMLPLILAGSEEPDSK